MSDKKEKPTKPEKDSEPKVVTLEVNNIVVMVARKRPGDKNGKNSA